MWYLKITTDHLEISLRFSCNTIQFLWWYVSIHIWCWYIAAHASQNIQSWIAYKSILKSTLFPGNNFLETSNFRHYINTWMDHRTGLNSEASSLTSWWVCTFADNPEFFLLNVFPMGNPLIDNRINFFKRQSISDRHWKIEQVIGHGHI